MMRVRVLLFAIIRDAAQTGEVEVELPVMATAKDAVDFVQLQFPQITQYLARSAIAVNRQYATTETVLADGDEVAIIPPVSGG
jgi:molybdopterin converting factor subunit 1